jgi:predicted permease
VVIGLKGGLKSPLLWGPVLGIAVVLARVHLPPVVVSSFELIGSATSGVAAFTVGLVLAAYPVRFALGVLLVPSRVSWCNRRCSALYFICFRSKVLSHA